MAVANCKRLSELTRDEWIAYHWVDVTTMGDAETMVLRLNERLPDEAAQAMHAWDDVADVLKVNRKRRTEGA